MGDARPRHHRLLWVRGLSGGIAVVLYFMAMQTLSVGLATLLNYTSPVFAVFIARASLGERLTWRAGAALALTVMLTDGSWMPMVAFAWYAAIFVALVSAHERRPTP